MSALIIITVVSLLALLAALPGDFARRGGTGGIVGLGSIASTVLPGIAFWSGSQTGSHTGSRGSRRSRRDDRRQRPGRPCGHPRVGGRHLQLTPAHINQTGAKGAE